MASTSDFNAEEWSMPVEAPLAAMQSALLDTPGSAA